jgi:hypothetical protein
MQHATIWQTHTGGRAVQIPPLVWAGEDKENIRDVFSFAGPLPEVGRCYNAKAAVFWLLGPNSALIDLELNFY